MEPTIDSAPWWQTGHWGACFPNRTWHTLHSYTLTNLSLSIGVNAIPRPSVLSFPIAFFRMWRELRFEHRRLSSPMGFCSVGGPCRLEVVRENKVGPTGPGLGLLAENQLCIIENRRMHQTPYCLLFASTTMAMAIAVSTMKRTVSSNPHPRKNPTHPSANPRAASRYGRLMYMQGWMNRPSHNISQGLPSSMGFSEDLSDSILQSHVSALFASLALEVVRLIQFVSLELLTIRIIESLLGTPNGEVDSVRHEPKIAMFHRISALRAFRRHVPSGEYRLTSPMVFSSIYFNRKVYWWLANILFPRLQSAGIDVGA